MTIIETVARARDLITGHFLAEDRTREFQRFDVRCKAIHPPTRGPAGTSGLLSVSAMTEEAEAESSSAPHKIRITSSGSIKAYVRFALAFLEEHPARPLVLHTIPPSDSKPNTEKSANSTVDSGTLLAPRLISVVEIIKREYLARLSSTGKGSGKHKARGVWQYTETGLLPKEGSAAEPLDESGGMEGGKNARSEQLVRALEGKTK